MNTHSTTSNEGWEDIATAPKDGTEIDVCTRHGERWTDVHWDEAKGDWFHWWVGDWGRMDMCRLGMTPTHWRPLPTPPVQS